MLSGCLFLLIGLAIILHLPVGGVARAILALAWIADSLRDLGRQARCHARVRRLMLDSHGSACSQDCRGKQYKTQILKGSVVVRHWAWLRLGFDDGLHYVEWFSSRHCSPQTWRRLQMMWRHAF